MTNKKNFLKLVSWEETDTVKRAKERIAKKQASKLTAVEWFAMVTGGWKYASKEQLEQAKEREQQQMLEFGKAVADHWGMMPVPMSNIKEMLDETKLIEPKKGTDLDLEMFAFLSWLDFNRDVKTIDGLLRKDGYDWYNSQWKSWLHNSDAGKRTLSHSGEVTWWGINTYRINTGEDNNPDTMMSPMDLENERFKHNPGDYNPAVRGKDHPATIEENNTTGETTIEFPRPADLLVPKQHKPEQYNPNKPSLDTIVFRFEQEENCVDGGLGEVLEVEAKSSLGIDGDGGAFYVLKTEQWAISDIDDLIVMLKRVEAALNATKPTSIHVK
jgi:hypothetical protein